jgi:hypothetical protein
MPNARAHASMLSEGTRQAIFDLRDERVVPEAQASGKIQLRQASGLALLSQPMACFLT